MKATSIGTTCCGLILLALMPTTTPADNPAPHLLDRSEVVFDPVAEQEAERLLIRAVGLWRRDNEQPGAPIVHIHLKGSPDGEVLAALERLPRLRSLIAPNVTRAQVMQLSHLRQLDALRIDDATFGKGEMKALSDMPRLRDLSLLFCEIDDSEALKEISHSRQLKSLCLFGSSGVTDDVVQALSSLKNLEIMRLSATAVTDASMADLAALPKLRSLNLSRTAVTDVGVAKFAKSRTLTELDLQLTAVGDVGVKELSHVKSLQTLKLRGTAVTDATMADLAGLPRLCFLRLDRTHLTTAGLKELARSKSLTELDLAKANVDDRDLEALAHLRTLRRLNLRGCDEITTAGLRRLKAALPDCEISGQEGKETPPGD